MAGLTEHCQVCGVPLAGLAGRLLAWTGVRRSSRNPNCCTQCNTHIEEGGLVEITVVFADLSSFTAMTQELGAAPTYEIVDGFLRLASGVLTKHGAFIDKFLGDAVMAFFNVPVKRADHAAAAVAAAFELQRALPELAKKSGVPLRASVGISTGFARVGRLGSDDIKDYTAIGDAVNLAARLQAQAKAGEVVVSSGVYGKISGQYPGAAPETLAVKGFREPVVAYRLGERASDAPAPAGEPAPPSPRSPASWTALILAVLGAGCLSSGLAGVLGLVFGVAPVASFLALTERLDHSPARVPMLLVAAALAAANLALLKRDPRHGGRARRWITLSALATLALVVVEIAMHYRNDRVFW